MRRVMMRAVLMGWVVCAASWSTGCTAWSYRGLELGAGPRDYDRVLPRAGLRQTSLGRIYLSETERGRTAAMLIMLGENRRVIGKWLAEHEASSADWLGARGARYRLRGEVKPAAMGMAGAPVEDVAALIVSYLDEPTDDEVLRRARALLRMGLVAVRGGAVDDGAIEEGGPAWEAPGGLPAVAVDEDGALKIEVVWE